MKVYTTDERKRPSVAWLELMETGSILIREKGIHLSKTSDRVSQNVLERKRSRVEKKRMIHRSLYR
jgi:hypothetical protein